MGSAAVLALERWHVDTLARWHLTTLSQPGAVTQFLRQFLPAAVIALFDLEQIQPVKDSFVDATLQEHFSL